MVAFGAILKIPLPSPARKRKGSQLPSACGGIEGGSCSLVRTDGICSENREKLAQLVLRRNAAVFADLEGFYPAGCRGSGPLLDRGLPAGAAAFVPRPESLAQHLPASRAVGLRRDLIQPARIVGQPFEHLTH